MEQCTIIVPHFINGHEFNIDIVYTIIRESCHSSTPYGLPRILNPS
jgi:hypothetical protein